VTGLRRSLGLFDATMVNVGVMIGSGVFLTAAPVAQALDSAPLNLLVWLLAALVSLAGALTLAELGASLPEAGGLFIYLREAFGPLAGFSYGWALFTVIQTAGSAAVAVAFATYMGHFVRLSPLGVAGVAAAAIAALTLVNVLGVREGVWTQNIVTSGKMIVLVGLVVLAFFAPGRSLAHLAPGGNLPRGLAGVRALGAALIGPLFAFDGWISLSYMAGEVKRPDRNLPRAALASVALVALLYLAVNGAYLYVLGVQGVARSPLTAAEVAGRVVGPRGASLAASLVVLATLGGLNGNIMAGPRVFYAMAASGLFFRRAAHIHPRLGTPAVSLLLQGACTVGFVFFGGFEQLLTATLFASWLYYGLGAVAVFVLRRRRDLPRPYRVWGYPIVPAVFLAAAATLLVTTIAADPRDSLIGLALLVSALPAYACFRWRRRGQDRTQQP
jgi:APA family basic amino acid/polyamine antiporter